MRGCIGLIGQSRISRRSQGPSRLRYLPYHQQRLPFPRNDPSPLEPPRNDREELAFRRTDGLLRRVFKHVLHCNLVNP